MIGAKYGLRRRYGWMWAGLALFGVLAVLFWLLAAGEFESGSAEPLSQDSAVAETADSDPDRFPLAPLRWAEVSGTVDFESVPVRAKQGDLEFELSLDPAIQQAAERFFPSSLPISGATVVVEVRTGRILALVERRNGGAENPLSLVPSPATAAYAPAASLMKYVTAAAAFENSQLRPDSEMNFRGRCGRLSYSSWIRDPAKDRRSLSVATAFGTSCNPVFAHIGLYWTGLPLLREYASRFGFDKHLESDLQIEESHASLPELGVDPEIIGRAAAGFGRSQLSVVHAAIIAAAAANDGKMMKPRIVDRAISTVDGAVVHEAKSKVVGQIYAKDTAEMMFLSMRDTVIRGTSRRYFRRKGTREFLHALGGKTGTLLDFENRKILYTWFSGVTSFGSDSDVGIAVLVGGDARRLVLASAVAQATLASVIQVRKLGAK